MRVLTRIGIVFLILLTIASSSGAALLWSQNAQIKAQDAQLQQQVKDLTDQVTKAAAIQDENRRLRAQLDQGSKLTPTSTRAIPGATTQPATATPVTTSATATPPSAEATSTPLPASNPLSPEQEAQLTSIG